MNVQERFLKYVSFPTSSDLESESNPSTASQFELAKYIENEMKEIGLENVRLDDKCYVYGELKASEGCEGLPSIGLIAHMDTAPDASGENIKTSIINYRGGDIKHSDTVITDEKTYPCLKKYVGQDLIITDGTTLLGSDDKAGCAEIMSAVEYLINHPEIKHGRIAVGFTPDEEIGRGADFFDIEGFACDYAYTVDGGALGEIEYENFNAANCKITFNGNNIHPGDAKDKMKNSILIANEFINMLPPFEAPAHTEKYEGFYHVAAFKGDETLSFIYMLIRDHDMDKFLARKEYVENVADFLNKKYGEGTVEPLIKDSYYNMRDKIAPHINIIRKAIKAMQAAGVKPIIQPIRGGTDGARLSYEGLPCPNLSTGGENFHGVHEFISVQALNKMVEVVVNICKTE